MKIEAIQSTNFESKKAPKQRYITGNMRASIESLLIRMNHSLEYENKGDSFITKILTKIKNEHGASFEDERRLTKKLPHNKQMTGFSILQFGKTRLDIDNESGEIIDYKKPFLKPWFLILKKAENILYDFRGCFNDPELKKETLSLHSPSPEGINNIKKMVLNFEKQRLEDITERLERDLSNECK